MKNIFFVFLFTIFCNEVFAKEALPLPAAIKDIADEIMKNQNIKQWDKIVLTDFSDSIEFQNYIEEELANKLINHFTIIDRKNLGILREELEFQNTGKVDPTSIKKIGSVYGADFVLWGYLKNKNLTIEVENVQKGTTAFSKTDSIKTEDKIWKNLEKNKYDCITCLGKSKIDDEVDLAISYLSKEIIKAKKKNILVYNIWADKSDLSKSIYNRIREILTTRTPAGNFNLITNRDKLGKIEEEMSFQASGEVDANTIKERGGKLRLQGADVIIYGNIRPIGTDYRLFLYAVDVENAKIIATISKMIDGNKEEIQKIEKSLPSKVTGIKVTAISSDKIIVSWDTISDARNFIVYRINPNGTEKPIQTGANGIIDFGLNKETEYCYYVQARNTGGIGEKSEQGRATTYGIPQFVFNYKPIIESRTENSIKIKWYKVPGTSYYNVKRFSKGEKNEWKTVGKNLRDTTYTDSSGLKSSTIYKYHIEAVNSAGSSQTDDFEAITKPIPPEKISATEIRADKITLKWEDKQEHISHYIIDGYPNDKISNKTKEISKLKTETHYQFRLKSVNKDREGHEFSSEFSEPYSVTTLGKPSAPNFVKIQIDSAYSTYYSKIPRINLNWDLVDIADSYVIYKNNKKIGETENTHYDDDYPKEKGMEVIYSISAKNVAGESEKKSVSILTEPPEPVITGEGYTKSNNRFFIEWASVPSANKYKIKYEISNKRNKKTKTGDTLIMDTFFKKENLDYSSDYIYCVTAVNKTGESGCSKENTKEFETLNVPQEPSNLEAFPLSADSIELSWNAVEEAKSYVIYICDADRRGKKSCDSLYSTSNTKYTHSGLKPNKEYEYGLVAKNAAGPSDTAYIREKTLILPPTKIKKEEEFGLDSVKISWQKAEGASYYRIYRKEKNGDSSLVGDYVSKSEWIDNKIEARKEYYYYVASISEDGKGNISTEAAKHLIPAAGTLILKNESSSGGNIIIGCEIKNGSKTTIKKDLYINPESEEKIPMPADGISYDLYITTNNNKSIKSESKVKIKADEKATFSFTGNRLRARQ